MLLFSVHTVNLPLQQPANDGIMVAGSDVAVNEAAVGLVVVGAHDMVDAEDETSLIVGDAQAVATLYKAVGESVSDGPAHVGDGGVVEVAADDDGVAAMALDVVVHGLGLA